MGKFRAGTPHPDPLAEGNAPHFTHEQHARIMHTATAVLGYQNSEQLVRFAHPRHVNQLLEPDGTIRDITAEGLDELAAHALNEVGPRKADELRAHFAQRRFFFIPNEAGTEYVYFQCATPENPEYSATPVIPPVEEAPE